MMISLRLSTFVNNVQRIWKRWTDDNGSLLAAGVAYYGALSFFPLILTLISGVGLMLCGLGVLLLIILIVGIALSAATEYSSAILPGSDRWWAVVRLCIPMVLDAAVFALTYRWLPKVQVLKRAQIIDSNGPLING